MRLLKLWLLLGAPRQVGQFEECTAMYQISDNAQHNHGMLHCVWMATYAMAGLYSLHSHFGRWPDF